VKEVMLVVCIPLPRLMVFLRILVRIIWLKILRVLTARQCSYAKIVQDHPHLQVIQVRKTAGQSLHTLTGRYHNTEV